METIQKLLLPESKVSEFVSLCVTSNITVLMAFSKEDFFAENKIQCYCIVPETSFDEFNYKFGKYLKK